MVTHNLDLVEVERDSFRGHKKSCSICDRVRIVYANEIAEDNGLCPIGRKQWHQWCEAWKGYVR